MSPVILLRLICFWILGFAVLVRWCQQKLYFLMVIEIPVLVLASWEIAKLSFPTIRDCHLIMCLLGISTLYFQTTIFIYHQYCLCSSFSLKRCLLCTGSFIGILLMFSLAGLAESLEISWHKHWDWINIILSLMFELLILIFMCWIYVLWWYQERLRATYEHANFSGLVLYKKIGFFALWFLLVGFHGIEILRAMDQQRIWLPEERWEILHQMLHFGVLFLLGLSSCGTRYHLITPYVLVKTDLELPSLIPQDDHQEPNFVAAAELAIVIRLGQKLDSVLDDIPTLKLESFDEKGSNYDHETLFQSTQPFETAEFLSVQQENLLVEIKNPILETLGMSYQETERNILRTNQWKYQLKGRLKHIQIQEYTPLNDLILVPFILTGIWRTTILPFELLITLLLLKSVPGSSYNLNQLRNHTLHKFSQLNDLVLIELIKILHLNTVALTPDLKLQHLHSLWELLQKYTGQQLTELLQTTREVMEEIYQSFDQEALLQNHTSYKMGLITLSRFFHLWLGIHCHLRLPKQNSSFETVSSTLEQYQQKEWLNIYFVHLKHWWSSFWEQPTISLNELALNTLQLLEHELHVFSMMGLEYSFQWEITETQAKKVTLTMSPDHLILYSCFQKCQTLQQVQDLSHERKYSSSPSATISVLSCLVLQHLSLDNFNCIILQQQPHWISFGVLLTWFLRNEETNTTHHLQIITTKSLPYTIWFREILFLLLKLKRPQCRPSIHFLNVRLNWLLQYQYREYLNDLKQILQQRSLNASYLAERKHQALSVSLEFEEAWSSQHLCRQYVSEVWMESQRGLNGVWLHSQNFLKTQSKIWIEQSLQNLQQLLTSHCGWYPLQYLGFQGNKTLHMLLYKQKLSLQHQTNRLLILNVLACGWFFQRETGQPLHVFWQIYMEQDPSRLQHVAQEFNLIINPEVVVRDILPSPPPRKRSLLDEEKKTAHHLQAPMSPQNLLMHSEDFSTLELL